ncbi:MAG TPA: ABC transporter ATP-binding protein [Gemmatimonadales bacterium]
MTPVLSAESIGKRFRGRKVLTSAGLWAHAGRLSALLGRNGSGKSTLMRVAAGVLRPDHGVIIYQDQRYASVRLARLARAGLFFIPERGLLAVWFSVADHFALLARAFTGVRVDHAIERLHLAPLLRRRAGQLSTGERRRVELALAIARVPTCLIADEPLQGLAPRDRELMKEALRGLAADGCAVVASGHEVEELLECADEVMWLTGGTTRSLGPPASARADAVFRRQYLGLDA